MAFELGGRGRITNVEELLRPLRSYVEVQGIVIHLDLDDAVDGTAEKGKIFPCRCAGAHHGGGQGDRAAYDVVDVLVRGQSQPETDRRRAA